MNDVSIFCIGLFQVRNCEAFEICLMYTPSNSFFIFSLVSPSTYFAEIRTLLHVTSTHALSHVREISLAFKIVLVCATNMFRPGYYDRPAFLKHFSSTTPQKHKKNKINTPRKILSAKLNIL